MGQSVEKLQRQARALVENTLKEAIAKGHEKDWDSRYKAKRLLERLEPVVFAYAPVPDRIFKALPDTRYGKQAPQ